MRYFVTFGMRLYPLLPHSLLSATNSRGVPRQPARFGERQEDGPIVRYEFRVAGPQRLLIEPQILAISKGIWKGLSTEGEMKCTRSKQTIVAFPSRYSRLSMNRNGHLFVILQATWFSDCIQIPRSLIYFDMCRSYVSID